MATENPTSVQEHIANELKLKLGIRVSPRTVGKYLREWPHREADPSLRWLTFVRNHAQAMVACDFLVVVTARFRILYAQKNEKDIKDMSASAKKTGAAAK
jgi:putative transposase